MSDYIVEIVEDRPGPGNMWHNGPNSCWVTYTHTPSMQTVTVYGQSQFKTRNKAKEIIEKLVEEIDYMPQYPENMDKITVERADYVQLIEDSKFLGALEAAGVDNWDGYSHAQEFQEEH